MKVVAILYGGPSVEHEISILTALEAVEAIDTTRFVPLPVYIDLGGRWWVGERLRDKRVYRALRAHGDERSLGLTEVSLVTTPDARGLVRVGERAAFGRGGAQSRAIAVDVWLPLLHGTTGEDGTIQGLLELSGLPYTGCDVRSASVGMSKPTTKALARLHDVPVLDWTVVHRHEFSARDPRPVVDRVSRWASWPLFVKPASLGSSVAVAVASDPIGLIAALVSVFQVDTEAMVEPCVVNPSEINVSVRRVGGVEVASVVEMPVGHSGVLTFEDKYVGPGTKLSGSTGMASMSRVIDPADLPPEYKAAAQRHACTVYGALGCHGVARIDFILDASSGELWFNEINTLPGSVAHYLWASSTPSVTYTELLTDMIGEACTRFQDRGGLSRDFGFRVLP